MMPVVRVIRKTTRRASLPSFVFGRSTTATGSLSTCATGLATHLDSQPKDVLSIGNKGSKKTLKKPEWLKASPPSGGKLEHCYSVGFLQYENTLHPITRSSHAYILPYIYILETLCLISS